MPGRLPAVCNSIGNLQLRNMCSSKSNSSFLGELNVLQIECNAQYAPPKYLLVPAFLPSAAAVDIST